jgi:membrane-associated phospholipid phosphatase
MGFPAMQNYTERPGLDSTVSMYEPFTLMRTAAEMSPTNSTTIRGTPYNSRWELQDIAFLSYLGTVVFLLLLFGVVLGHHARVGQLLLYFMAVGAAGMGMKFLPHLVNNHFTRFLRWFYPALLLYACFVATGRMIHLIQPEYIDPILTLADRVLFGRDMTPWLQGAARPWLTELLYFCYFSYYFMIMVVGVPLFVRAFRGGSGDQDRALREFIFAVSLVFWFCYVHFLFTPAGGPIFFDGYPIPVLKLTGGPITTIERWLFENGNIVGGAFPSSHVAAATVIAAYSVRFRIVPWLLVPITIGMGIATMYNGYHYGVDVVYALIIAAVAIYVIPRLFDRYERRLVLESQEPGEGPAVYFADRAD